MSNTWDRDDLPSQEATRINQAREPVYGSPVGNYQEFAKILSVIFGHDVSAPQAAMVMVGLKFMRECQGEFKLDYRDNLDDICGFTNIVHLCKEADSGSPSDATRA